MTARKAGKTKRSLPKSSRVFAGDLLRKAEIENSHQEFKARRVEVRQLEREQNFLITSAQNNTLVRTDVHKTFMRIADYYHALYKVIPIRYKNPTGYAPQLQGTNDRWAESLHPFMIEDKLQIHRRLAIMGEWRLQATTERPLNGLESIGRESSAIYGHGRLQMHTVPVPSSDFPKILYTTGSVTEKNYSNTGLGQKGWDNHVFGAVLVRKSGKLFHMRHLEWSEESKSVQDVDMEFTPTQTRRVGAPVVVNGDEHWRFADEPTMQAVYGPGGIVDLVRPRYLIRHDALDSYAISHHHENDPFIRWMKAKLGLNNMEDELQYTLRRIDESTPDYSKNRDGITPEFCENMMVESNHHNHFLKWLQRVDARRETTNAELYHKMKTAIYKGMELRKGGIFVPDAFEVYTKNFYEMRSRTTFMRATVPFRPYNHILNLHGHEGPGGVKGSPMSFAKMGVPSITGHIHAPWILLLGKGVGHASETEREYIHSPTRWLHTAAIEHYNGTSQLIHIVNGGF